jgi:flagellin-like protein
MRGRRSFRVEHRGLAEIVGTLMLVLIVVAAATAFSFFVASTEQTNLAEKNQLQLKNLENVTIDSVNTTPGYTVPTPGGTFYSGNLTLVLSSSDIYNTSLTDISIGGNPARFFCEDPGCNSSQVSDAANFHEFPVAGGSTFLTLLPFSVTAVTINYSAFFIQPFVFSKASVQVQMGTTRGNEFVETLFPPIPVIGVNFVSNYPVLDGAQSYQPQSGSSPDAAVNQWAWTVKSPTDPNYTGAITYYGEQIQLPDQFVTSPATTYTITLTVTNTLGLSQITSQVYNSP